MLDYNILNQKATVTLYADDEKITFKDLMSKTYKDNPYVNGRPLIVNKYYVARPDLISLAVYGDDKYADLICKINGISNPFELNEGMILFIPNSVALPTMLNGVQQSTMDDFLDVSKKYKKNRKYLSFDKNASINKNTSSSLKKYNNERRTPADQTVLDKNYTINKDLGIVIY